MAKGSGASIFLLIMLLAALAFASYLLYENLPIGEKQELKMQNTSGSDSIIEIGSGGGASYDGEMQFYPNMRFSKLPISYSISSQCSAEKTGQMQEAIEIISSEAGISFVQASAEGDIEIMCRELDKKEIRNRDYYVAGEGGPKEIVNTSLFNVILKGEVLLLKESECEEPLVSMHELLHALGFDHSVNELSVMYNVSSCRQKITADIINEIKRLYSIESLPELQLTDINATKNGRYLSFEARIRNSGLADSGSTTLAVYAEGELIGSYDIDAIEIGAGIFLSVENSRLPGRNVNEVRFVIDPENSIRELSEENNAVVLNTESA